MSMGTPPGSPPPNVPQTNTKAWVAAAAATVIPIVLQNISGADAAFSTIWDWVACGTFGTDCPVPQMIANAFKSVISAVIGGGFTGFLTYYINNKPK